MRTSRSDNDSNRRRRTSTGPTPSSRTQSFSCSADLLRAFEHRAFQLGCSFDWLLEEAMQRLLVEGNDLETREVAKNDSMPPPPESVHQVKPRSKLPSLPLPSPPDAAVSTVPPPPARAPALPRPKTPTPIEEPLVLHYDNEQLVIDRHPYVIGRSAIVADLVIEDTEVSRRHAVIERTAEGWVITDLGSTNGIIVDGEVVRRAVLRAGVVMSIGPMAFGVASPA